MLPPGGSVDSWYMMRAVRQPFLSCFRRPQKEVQKRRESSLQINVRGIAGSAFEQRAHLTRYLENGRLELSNNRAERSIKPFVMGRKNWLFANTPGGAQASAVIYSLIETAKENGLDPYRYLLWILRNAPGLSETG